MPVYAELGKTKVTVQELLEFKKGDIIKIEKRINEEIEVIIGSRRKLAARPGTVEGRKAVRVIRPLTDEDLVDLDITYKEEQ
jgi:flagellar motor switch protein FliM